MRHTFLANRRVQSKTLPQIQSTLARTQSQQSQHSYVQNQKE